MAESLGLEVRPEFRPQVLPLTSCLSLVPSSEWGRRPHLPGLRGPREHSAQPLPQNNTKHSNYDDLGMRSKSQIIFSFKSISRSTDIRPKH